MANKTVVRCTWAGYLIYTPKHANIRWSLCASSDIGQVSLKVGSVNANRQSLADAPIWLFSFIKSIFDRGFIGKNGRLNSAIVSTIYSTFPLFIIHPLFRFGSQPFAAWFITGIFFQWESKVEKFPVTQSLTFMEFITMTSCTQAEHSRHKVLIFHSYVSLLCRDNFGETRWPC